MKLNPEKIKQIDEMLMSGNRTLGQIAQIAGISRTYLDVLIKRFEKAGQVYPKRRFTTEDIKEILK